MNLRRIMAVIAPAAALLATVYLVANGCSKGTETPEARQARIEAGNLTDFEIENGIGPITETVQLSPLDPHLAGQGEALFKDKCVACHTLDEKKIGPALRGVTSRRTPAYVMNQILNPENMGKYHPEGKRLTAEYMQSMTVSGVSGPDARALLEFLRNEADKAPHSAQAK
jgi:cytochrome c